MGGSFLGSEASFESRTLAEEQDALPLEDGARSKVGSWQVDVQRLLRISRG